MEIRGYICTCYIHYHMFVKVTLPGKTHPCFQDCLLCSTILFIWVSLHVCHEFLQCLCFCRSIFLQGVLEGNDDVRIGKGGKVGRLGKVRQSVIVRGGETAEAAPRRGTKALCAARAACFSKGTRHDLVVSVVCALCEGDVVDAASARDLARRSAGAQNDVGGVECRSAAPKNPVGCLEIGNVKGGRRHSKSTDFQGPIISRK